MGEILLIAADWRLRALVCAQLLEEGYVVKALPSLELAVAALVRGGEQPGLVILDTHGIEIKAPRLSDLWRLAGGAPFILCGGVFSQAELSQVDVPFARVLLRPFRVGDLVEQVRKVLGCPGDSPTTQERSLELE